MATQQRQSPQTQTLERERPSEQPRSQQDARLLEEIIRKQSALSPRGQAIRSVLSSGAQYLDELLPAHLRGQADRFIKRAMLTFKRNPHLERCSEDSFIRCVLEAAELGLAIDGRLAHAVPYRNKKMINGKEQWVDEAQLIIDYKGLIAIAKRTGQIKDCYAELVRANDDFAHSKDGGTHHLHHTWNINKPRGQILGAYAIVVFPDDSWRYYLMDNEEINDHHRAKSKSWNSKPEGAGPWKTDEGEMRKKTPIRRILKPLIDDPGFSRAMEIDDRDYEYEPQEERATRPPVGRVSLRDNGRSEPAAPIDSGSRPEVDEQPELAASDEPAVQDEDDDLARGAFVAEVSQGIREAGTQFDLENGPGALMVKNRQWLGESNYGALLQQYQAKANEFAARKPANPKRDF